MKTNTLWIAGCVGLVLAMTGCSTTPEKAAAKEVLSEEVNEAVSMFKAKDPSIQSFFDKSYGYAVLPKVTKGAFWIGVAGGRGQVFSQGKMIGFCRMDQATLGFSFGGEFFREIIFFRQEQDLRRFTSGEFTFSAQVTGTAIAVGAAANTDYKDGIAVFVMADRGLMIDASLGGQNFKFASDAIQ